MTGCRVVEEYGIVLAGKRRLDLGNGAGRNVLVLTGIVKQDGLADLCRQLQVLVDAATVKTHGSIGLAQRCGAEGQLAAQAVAQGGDLAC